MTFFVVFVERVSQRRIVVNYAKRQQGRRVYAAQSTQFTAESEYGGGNPGNLRFQYYTVPGNHHVAGSGVVLVELADNNFAVFAAWATALCVTLCVCNHLLLFLLHGVGFNPRETADNPEEVRCICTREFVRESKRRKYIDKVMTRLTLVGALYITFICLIPEFMRDAMKVPFYFGGTSLLIVVVVIMDFMAQVQTLMMSSQYESALKKANLKGYGR